MKHLRSNLLAGIVALLAAIEHSSAQTPPVLGIQIFAGINITGTTGSVYAVQSNPDVANTNGWTSVAFVQLPETNHLFVDTTAPATAKRFYRAVLQNPPTNMVFIAPNSFTQGTLSNDLQSAADEKPQTRVTLTHGYWIGKFEVTQAEYLAVVGSNPSFFTNSLSNPVETVTWFDASNYCRLLTQQELSAGRIPAGAHYRLPTESEWEYAARAGTSTRFYFGDDPTTLTNYAWFSDNSGFQTHPVGQKLPNAWGLYDVEGNVFEWTLDYYARYPGGFAIDPQGPPAPFDFLSTFKVTRGGGFDFPDSSCRSAARNIFAPADFLNDFNLGFRVVLATGSP